MKNNEKEQKKQNGFVRFLKRIFVHNIGWKLLALVSAIAIWVLAIGFSGNW